MVDKLKEIEKRFLDVEGELSKPEVINDMKKYTSLNKEYKSLGKIVRGIKEYKPDITVQYHGHSGPGFSVASSLEVARNGADIIDVSMEPLSWGTTHADLLTVHEILKDDGFIIKDFDRKSYIKNPKISRAFFFAW